MDWFGKAKQATTAAIALPPEKPVERIAATYDVRAYCGNCRWRGWIKMPLGVAVAYSRCPNCETRNMHTEIR